ncbi:(S)-2-hydroxy-acid oxidase [Neofusicoccum parvum]|nr:(S)-2-hydroxy-acid oxidase [Neofusicoccum parvum]
MADQPLPPPVPPNDLILSIDDLKEAGSKKLPFATREFFNSGATAQTTLSENTTAFSKYRLRPRVLRDVSAIDTTTTVFGQRIAFPLCIAPAGAQALAHPSGELATARACAKRRVHMGVSSMANHGLGAIRAAGTAVWPAAAHAVQLYTMVDRAREEAVVRAAEAAGCAAALLTADSPVLGARHNERRNAFRVPDGAAFPIVGLGAGVIDGARFAATNSDAHSWAEVAWLRGVTRMEVWVKGVLTPEDVVLAREHGCDGVIVSNHGGRQLDGAPATVDVLAACVEAAEGKIRVHVDSGIRSGADIFKALALGAECCWVGRPVLWGLAYDGEAGVDKMLDILYEDFKRCMQLTGCTSVSDISKDCLGIFRSDGPLARL